MNSWNGAVNSSCLASARSTCSSPSTARRTSWPVSSSVMGAPFGVAPKGGGDELAAGAEVLGGIDRVEVDAGQERGGCTLLLHGLTGAAGEVEVVPHAGGVDLQVGEAVGQPGRGRPD